MKQPKETLRLPASWVGLIVGATTLFVSSFVPIETQLSEVTVWVIRIVCSVLGGLYYYLVRQMEKRRR